jgi:Na+/melibiose symporter-like transporter
VCHQPTFNMGSTRTLWMLPCVESTLHRLTKQKKTKNNIKHKKQKNLQNKKRQKNFFFIIIIIHRYIWSNGI